MSKAPIGHAGIFVDPQPGDIVLFRYSAGWRRGEVVAEGSTLRVPVRRIEAATPRERKRIYQRNRTQIYRPRS